jgi:hypothetical protein
VSATPPRNKSYPTSTWHDPQLTHGTRFRYNRGCRCPECRAAVSEYRRQSSEVQRDASFLDCSEAIDEIAAILHGS